MTEIINIGKTHNEVIAYHAKHSLLYFIKTYPGLKIYPWQERLMEYLDKREDKDANKH